MDIASLWNRKQNKYVVEGEGTLSAYERPAAAHAALERRAFVGEALRLNEIIRGGPYVADLEALQGISPFARNLATVLRDVAPHEWASRLSDLERLARMTQRWNEEGR